jgi:undecaprenyl-diphosphatase
VTTTPPVPPTPARIARLWPLASSIAALALVAALASVIVYREKNKPFGFELEWMGELVEHRSGFWTVVALVFNSLGGGLIAVFAVPIAIALALVVWRRGWASLYFLLATIVSAGTVKLVKQLIGRPRPEDILVTPDFGSFPSGHSANAAIIAATLGIIFARTWVWAAGAVYTVAMMLSRTYLGAHWISDTVGGALIGLGIAVILWAPFAAKLHRERYAAHPPIWSKHTAR